MARNPDPADEDQLSYVGNVRAWPSEVENFGQRVGTWSTKEEQGLAPGTYRPGRVGTEFSPPGPPPVAAD